MFKLDKSGTFTVLHSFSVSDGAEPIAGLITDSAGNLYGTTSVGGSDTVGCPGVGGSSGLQPGCGTVFKLDSSGNLIVLHSFTKSEGEFPAAGLVMDSLGNLYGTTGSGGPSGGGTVFKLDTSGTLTVLHSLPAHGVSFQPEAGLILDSAGNLYGATINGGTSTACPGFGCGIIFRLDTSGNNFSVLHTFSGSDGALPLGGLTLDSVGNLYGTTLQGGSSTPCPGIPNSLPGCGTVFKLDRSGNNFSVVHTFSGSDGALPRGSLTLDSAGNLYGMTQFGGSSGRGTVYLLASSPQNATQVIVNQVNALCSQGVLNSGQCNSLTRELDQAISLLNKGKTAEAVQSLQDFVSEVQDLQNSGVLTASQAESLISEANTVIGSLSS